MNFCHLFPKSEMGYKVAMLAEIEAIHSLIT